MAVRKFFVGFVRNADGRQPPNRPGPLTDQYPLGLVGDWSRSQVRLLNAGRRQAVLLGDCFVPDRDLVETLARSAPLPETAEAIAGQAGSYSVVVTEGKTVAVTGDIAGLHRIWFRIREEGVGYASSLLPLAAEVDYRIDRRMVAAHLFCANYNSSLGGNSLFTGVQSLAPGQVLLIRNGIASVVQRRFPSTRIDFSATGTALCHALQTGVRHRVIGAASVSADFSGGLDSSTLALLAARHYQRPMRVITYADKFACNDDDIVHAARFVTTEPLLRQTVVEGTAHTLPFTDMAAMPFTEEPSLDSVIYARDRARLLPAAGTSVHLVGDGGDVVLGAPLTYLADLVRTRRLRRFVREARSWARLRHRPVYRVIRAAVEASRASYSATLIRLADDLEDDAPLEGERRSAVERNIVWASLSRSAAWGTSAARRAVAEYLRHAARSVSDAEGADSHTLRTIHRHTTASRSFVDIAEHLGVRIAMPFFDNQVVTACLSVPAAERISVHQAKPLLGAAMADLLPAELFARRTKGDYSSCEYHGIRRNAAVLRSLLRDSRLGDLGIIEPSRVLRELETAISGTYADMASLGEVFAFEMWLRGLDNFSRASSFDQLAQLEVH